MSNIDCGSCNDLRNNAPEFVQNGVTDTVCASLQNDTGFNPNLTVLHTDCEDLNDANDCLVGRMDGELEAYEVCDWKKFMHKFIPNVYETIKAMICSMCGIWTNIHKHDCEIQNLYNGFSFGVGEDEESSSYLVAGKGVSFATRTPTSDDDNHVDFALDYIAGGLMRGVVSVDQFTENFTDTIPVWNYDNGNTAVKSQERLGNQYWNQIGVTEDGNELLVEARIKTSDYPEVRSIWNGDGQTVNMGGYLVSTNVFTAGQYAYGQHGGCSQTTGVPFNENCDEGHQVPDGWTYIQVRVSYIMAFQKSTTPRWWMGIRFNRSNIDC